LRNFDLARARKPFQGRLYVFLSLKLRVLFRLLPREKPKPPGIEPVCAPVESEIEVYLHIIHDCPAAYSVEREFDPADHSVLGDHASTPRSEQVIATEASPQRRDHSPHGSLVLINEHSLCFHPSPQSVRAGVGSRTDYLVDTLIAASSHFSGAGDFVWDINPCSPGGFNPVVTINNIPLPVILNHFDRIALPAICPHAFGELANLT
jgi:hypothetical protein